MNNPDVELTPEVRERLERIKPEDHQDMLELARYLKLCIERPVDDDHYDKIARDVACGYSRANGGSVDETIDRIHGAFEGAYGVTPAQYEAYVQEKSTPVVDKKELSHVLHHGRGIEDRTPTSEEKRDIQITFTRKPSEMKDVQEFSARDSELARVMETVNLTAEDYDDCVDNFFAQRDWLTSKGGHRNGVLQVIEVKAPERQTLYVDPSGYSYARYVGVSENPPEQKDYNKSVQDVATQANVQEKSPSTYEKYGSGHVSKRKTMREKELGR